MTDIEDLDATIGFSRPCTRSLLGTVESYTAHMFVCLATPPEQWAPEVEKSSEFFKELSQLLKANRDAIGRIKLTACDISPLTPGDNEVLYFNGSDNGWRIGGLTKDNMNQLIEFLKDQSATTSLKVTPLTQDWSIFVCCHQARDKRCGYCGTRIYEEISKLLNEKDLYSRVLMGKVSHVGGHEFAANVLIFPRGVWFGYITPQDVPRVIEYIQSGQIPKDKLRGIMKMDKQETIAMYQ